MYMGPDSNPFMSVIPPWPLLVIKLREMGINSESDLIAEALESIGWRG
jgi:hypothetical protein